MASLGFFFAFRTRSSSRASANVFVSFLATILSFSPRRLVVAVWAPQMLRETRFQNNSRANVVADQMILSEHIPKAWYSYQGGELNSRPRAYESPALPLSYPGFRIS